MSRRFDSSESLPCNSIMRLRRSILTFSGTLSGIVLEARVPGRSEYLNMNELSKPTSRISDKVCSKSSSVSPENPVKRSVEMPQPGIMDLIAAMRSRYHSRVYLRFIALSTAVLPLCTGRWIWLHIFGREAMARNVSSVMSLGCEVVKRTLIPGTASATFKSSAVKSVICPVSGST